MTCASRDSLAGAAWVRRGRGVVGRPRLSWGVGRWVQHGRVHLIVVSVWRWRIWVQDIERNKDELAQQVFAWVSWIRSTQHKTPVPHLAKFYRAVVPPSGWSEKLHSLEAQVWNIPKKVKKKKRHEVFLLTTVNQSHPGGLTLFIKTSKQQR